MTELIDTYLENVVVLPAADFSKDFIHYNGQILRKLRKKMTRKLAATPMAAPQVAAPVRITT